MNDNRLKIVQDILKLLTNEFVKPEDFGKALKAVLDRIESTKADLQNEIDRNKSGSKSDYQKLLHSYSQLEANIKELLEVLADDIERKNDAKINLLRKEIEAQIPDLADLEASVYRLSKAISTIDKGLSEFKADFPDVLELKIGNAIDDLRKELKKYADSRPKTETVSRSVFSTVGMQVYNQNSKVGTKVNEINFSTGLLAFLSDGRMTVTATGSGIGEPVEPESGSGTTFVFATKPTLIVSDGIAYRENKGWTWDDGTKTATLSVASSYDTYAL